MTEFGAFRLHLKWSLLRIAGPALAAAAAIVAVASAPDRVITSPEISRVMVNALAVTAPVLSAVAAWDGLRERRAGGGFLLDGAARPNGQAALAQALAGIVWTTPIWMLPLLCLIGYSWLLGSLAAPPQFLNLAVLVVLIAWLSTLGYLLAFAIRHWIAVLSAALFAAVLYGVAAFPVLGVVLTALNPFTDRSGSEFLEPSLVNLAGVLLCMVGVAVATLALFIVLPPAWSAILAAATGLVLAVSGAWVVAVQDGHWGDTVDVTDRLVPLSAEGLTLRVLPPYVPLEDDLRSRWSEVQEIFADTPAAFSELTQDSDGHTDGMAGFRRLYLGDRGDVAGASVAESFIDVVVPKCGEREGWVWTFLVQYRIAGPGGYQGTTFTDQHDDILIRLQSVDTSALAVWMSEHYDGFVNCTLTVEDLPV